MDLDLDDHFTELSNSFTSWLISSKNVVINPSITLADLRSSGAGRGVVASSPLSKGETVFKVPRTGVLSVESSRLRVLVPELSTLDPWLALVLVLIYETRPQSPWKPYMDLLPRSFDTLMFWAPDELAELQGSAVVGKVGKEDAEKAFSDELWPIVRRHDEVFRDTEVSGGDLGRLVEVAHRMGSIVMSYSFDLEVPGGDPRTEEEEEEEEGKGYYKGMVPLADMLNANGKLNNCRLYQTPTALAMKTTRPVPAGGELFNDYGPLPRSDLLRRYGYITEEYADYDVVEISAASLVAGFALDKRDTAERVDYLLDEGVLDDAFDISTDLEIPEEVVVTVNTFLLSVEEFAALKAAGKVPKAKKSKAGVQALVKVLEGRLAEYTSGIEDDETLLVSGGVGGKKRLAVEVRLGEKRILKGALEKLGEWEESAKRAGSGGADGERGAKRIKI